MLVSLMGDTTLVFYLIKIFKYFKLQIYFTCRGESIVKTMFEIVYDEIVTPLMNQGFSDDEIIDFMVQKDLSREVAWMLMTPTVLKKQLCKKKIILPIVFENILCFPPGSHPPSLQDATGYGPINKGSGTLSV